MSVADFGGWHQILDRVVHGSDLLAHEAEAILADIFEGDATDAQIGALLVALKTKGETPAEIEGFVRAMLARTDGPVVPEGTIDIVGTGGDRSGSVNVSTMTSFVVAGAGVPVCKHGNRAASSKVGAADVLEHLGVAIDLDARGVEACIEHANMGFCFAQRFHPAFRPLGPIRRELGIPTVFNILGPLANPARVTRQLIGVADGRVAATMAEVLAALGSTRAAIVHGDDGLDEISLTSPTTIHELVVDPSGNPTVTSTRIDPRDYGFSLVEPEALRGGELETNAHAVLAVLDGEPGPHRDVVVLNAGVALVVAGVVNSPDEGFELARQSLDLGAARHVLHSLIEASTAAAARG